MRTQRISSVVLENGIIPHVIMEEGKSGYELELIYEKQRQIPPA